MNAQPFTTLAVLAGGLALLAGCATLSGPGVAQDSTKYTIESTEKFVPLDKPTQAVVACTGLRERIRPDGRFEVVANIKNRDEATQRVQINCVFKDVQGFSIGEETPFQLVRLAGNATETVRFASANPQARRYTIRVKQVR